MFYTLAENRPRHGDDWMSDGARPSILKVHKVSEVNGERLKENSSKHEEPLVH